MNAKIQKNLYMVSYFLNAYTSEKLKDISIEELVTEIKGPSHKMPVEEIRHEDDNIKRQKLKKNLSGITTSCCVEHHRNTNEIISMSGLLQIDLDKLLNKDVNKVKQQLIEDPFTFACFDSPSGKLKLIIKVLPELQLHKPQFLAAKKYYFDKYGLEIDDSTKDPARLMFVSYDPNIYYNPSSLVFEGKIEVNNNVEVKTKLNTIIQKDALKLIEAIETKSIDITGSHIDWIKIIYSLIEIFGSNCNEYIHRVSQFYPKYDYKETEQKIEACLKSGRKGITPRTFFYAAKKHGITFNSVKEENEKAKIVTNKYTLAKRYFKDKYEFRFNTLFLEFEYRCKGENKYKRLNENDIFIELQEKGLSLSMTGLLALLKSSYVLQYDPIINYFESLPKWDGKDYIDELASYIIIKDHEVFKYHLKKWLVRVVACALLDSYFNKQAFVFIGGQDSGKSTLTRFFCPNELSEHIIENVSTDKDSRIAMAKNFIAILDELSSLSKADIDALKALFSMERLNDRLPYDRKNTILPRRASFMGSTNNTEFLSDPTGSVRWLCFHIEDINWEYSKKIDINKVYAQAYALYKSGNFNYNFTREDIAQNEKRNKKFYTKSIEYELINQYYKPDTERHESNFIQPVQIVIKLNRITDGAIRLNHINVGKALKLLGYEKVKNSQFDIYGYYLKEK